MGFLELRSSTKILNPPDARRAACVRAQPECVRLPVEDDALPSSKPPVRIFVGTEPGQHRAERVFVWSVEQNRNPSRSYEIYLMKDLAGFDRRGWTTGFTNYRFAVPHLAGCRGRAIFNDVDEAYFGDPADLFDAEMGDHGYLATSDSETSVMLIDCERMASIWPLEICQHKLKKQMLGRTLRENPDIRGDLSSRWTARDEEFTSGFSKLQHWTTLQTQPWRPVPDRFVYQLNPTGHLWFDLKRAADAAGYQVFNASRPSSLFSELIDGIRGAARLAPTRRTQVSTTSERLEDVIEAVTARTLLEYGLALACDDPGPRAGYSEGLEISRFDLARPDADPGTCDGVICEGVLEFLPDEDAPWVIGDLFERAGRFVYAVVDNQSRSERLGGGGSLESRPRDPSWWLEYFEIASRRHPELHWTLVLVDRDARGREIVRVRDGGFRSQSAPRVWVVTDDRRSSTSQALGLADALGWRYETKKLRPQLRDRIAGLIGDGISLTRNRAAAAELVPPWPDLVISAGRHCAAVASWIREQDQGRTRLVHVGREGGAVADIFDAVVTPAYAHLWPHPKRIETAAPLTRPRRANGAEFETHRTRPFGSCRKPHVLLLMNAPADSSPDPVQVHLMGSEVRRFVEAAGGSILALTGAETEARAEVALGVGLGSSFLVHRAPEPDSEDLVARCMDDADAVVVAGNDALLVAEAASSGKPTFIYPLPRRRFAPALRLRRWVEELANRRPRNLRGTARPQQGLEYLAARLIERGIVRPVSEPEELHRRLYQLGVAAPYGTPFESFHGALTEAEDVAGRIQALLGYPASVPAD